MIRQPNIEETMQALELLYMSGPNMFSYFLIKQPPEIYSVLKIFFTKEDVIFSNVNTLVKIENNTVCGLLVTVPGKEVYILEKNMGKYGKELVKEIGIIGVFKMLFRSRIKLNLHNDDEYYISNLAVSEKHRRKGIAHELLLKAEEIAMEKHFKKLSLLVELENQHAISIYEKFGFRITETIELPKNFRKYKLSGFHRMVKDI